MPVLASQNHRQTVATEKNPSSHNLKLEGKNNRGLEHDFFQSSFLAPIFDNGDGDDLPKVKGASFDFGKLSLLPKEKTNILPKLTINAPGDKYEQEADWMAEHLIRQKDPISPRISRRNISLQRKCKACEAEDKEEKETLMRKAATHGGYEVPPSLAFELNATKGKGIPLSSTTREHMENAFGTGFSKVRIHADTKSAAISRKIKARAFTHGSDIYFNHGEYNLGHEQGMRLLTHELTHVVQQSASASASNGIKSGSIQRKGGTVGGFFRNLGRSIASIFGDELEYSDEDIQTYLDVLNEGDIEDDFDSDDKARAVVRRWTTGSIPLSRDIKVLLIREMLSGYTGKADRQAILDILTGSQGELTYIINRVDPDALRRKFRGTDLEALNTLLATTPTPLAPPATVPSAGPEDFQIRRIPRNSEGQVFFAGGSSVLTRSAELQIDIVKLTAPASVRLVGYTSMEEPPSLAQDRADTVKNRFEASPDSVVVDSAVGNASATATRSDFARARSVEILVGAAPPSTLDCEELDSDGNVVNPPTSPCADMDPETETDFNAALVIANEAMSAAMNAINNSHSDYNAALIQRFFGNDDATTLSALNTNMANLQTHVSGLPGITQCGGQCDVGGCESGAIAYNTEVDAASTMTLCVPIFKNLNQNDQARNLIHESAHGTSPLGGATAPTEGTKDVAYRHERMMFHLSPEDRLRNSDSYALFALYAKEIKDTGNQSAIPSGINVPPSDRITGITGSDLNALELALAHLEKRLTWAADHSNQLFGRAVKVKEGTLRWADTWAEPYMQEAAARFPLTAPPNAPTMDDMAVLAAIVDRYKTMKSSVKQNLTISGMPSGLINWPRASGSASDTLQIGPDFFRATSDDQVSLLLENLAVATPDMEPAFVPAYVYFAEFIHNNAS